MSPPSDSDVSELEEFLRRLSLAQGSERAEILQGITPLVDGLGSRADWVRRLHDDHVLDSLFGGLTTSEGDKEEETGAVTDVLVKINQFLDQNVVIQK